MCVSKPPIQGTISIADAKNAIQWYDLIFGCFLGEDIILDGLKDFRYMRLHSQMTQSTLNYGNLQSFSFHV